MKKRLNKIFKNYIIIFIYFAFIAKANGQDSLVTLSLDQLIEIVRQYHPDIRKADIEIQKSKEEITLAKAAFDPVLSNYIGTKDFNNTLYYNNFTPSLKIPTWYGVELRAGLESLNGDRIDPSSTPGQTNFAGIKVPLAKNLVLDKRRAYLKQARISNKMSEVEKQAQVNNVLMEAIQFYWEWIKHYQMYQLASNNVKINEARFLFIKKSFINGERAAIDTIEALSQLQSFQFLQSKTLLEFQNAGLQLSNFLWSIDGRPVILSNNVVPIEKWEEEAIIDDNKIVINELMSQVNDNHPLLRIYDFKLNNLQLDRKLKFQELLPKIDLSYNRLGKSYNLLNTATQRNLFNENYLVGLSFEMPLFLSQGRAEYAISKLKINETTIDRENKKLQLQVKLKSYYNEYLNLIEQIKFQEANYSNQQILLKAEQLRLENGESSLFLVNARENKVLESFEKLIEIKTKYYKTIFSIQWAAGLLK